MPLILDLPPELLVLIFEYAHGQSRNITQTCRSFAAIAHSISSLWSFINLRPSHFVPSGPAHLSIRLNRVGTSPLHVNVCATIAEDPAVIAAMCFTLAPYASQIRNLYISTDMSVLAGTILYKAFISAIETSHELRSLSIQVREDELPHIGTSMDPDHVLSRAAEILPALESLTLPIFYECLPLLTAPFARLHTLVLDGSFAEGPSSLASICTILQHSPGLETFWLKNIDRFACENIDRPSLSLLHRPPVPIPVLLPRLARVAVTVPGTGLSILQCIDAPALHSLHLDGSRESIWDNTWITSDAEELERGFRKLAPRAPSLRHLSLTETYPSRPCWRWLLLGDHDGARLPFPRLESIVTRGPDPGSGEGFNAINDEVILHFLHARRIVPLRRLALLRCAGECLSGSALVQASEAILLNSPDGTLELEIDASCGGVTEDHLEALRELGVHLIYHKEVQQEMQWWVQVNGIDASDSFAY